MDNLFADLKRSLTEELDGCRRLLGLASRKKKILLEKFSSELSRIVAQEEELVDSLINMGIARRTIVSQLTGDENSHIEKALEFIDNTDRKSDIWMLVDQLREVTGQIRAVNEENRKLLEQALELTQYSIKLFTRLPESPTYNRPGTDKKVPTVSTIFDKKV